MAGKFGPLPQWCGECGKKRNRLMERRRAAARKLRIRDDAPQREVACVDCGRPLEWSGKNRPKERCDPCRVVRNREKGRERSIAWIKANPDLARERWRQGYQRNIERIRATKLDQHYRYKYGITRAERDRMLAEQGGRCKICGGEPDPRHQGGRLHVDHCHETGRVRGLLCGHCNTAIGLLKEDPRLFESAVLYLTEATMEKGA